MIETMIPTIGDAISLAVLAAFAVALLWAAVTGAADLELLDRRSEPSPPPREPRSLVRVLDPAPFDWQHETDL